MTEAGFPPPIDLKRSMNTLDTFGSGDSYDRDNLNNGGQVNLNEEVVVYPDTKFTPHDILSPGYERIHISKLWKKNNAGTISFNIEAINSFIPDSLTSYFNSNMHMSNTWFHNFEQQRDSTNEGRTIIEAVVSMPNEVMPPSDEDNETFTYVLDEWIQSRHSAGLHMNRGDSSQRGIIQQRL